MMVDFHVCSWPRPELNADDTSLAEYFDAMNDEPLQLLLAALQHRQQPAASKSADNTPDGMANGTAVDGAANCAASGTAATQPEGRSLPTSDHGSDGSGSQAELPVATDGCAFAAAVDAFDSSGGGGNDGIEQRPPVITFSHFLPFQVHYLLVAPVRRACYCASCATSQCQTIAALVRTSNAFLLDVACLL